MNYIVLEDIRFRAYHGCLEAEKKLGAEFSVDLWLGGDFDREARNDRLGEDSVDYARVIRLVLDEMETPSRLIENAAWRIIRRIMDTYPQLAYVKVKLSKWAPPVPGQIGRASVVMEEYRK